MSKLNDIKNKKRQQRNLKPAQVLSAAVEVGEKEIINKRKVEKNIERKRVSFDLRTDLHKELKLQSLIQEKNIYILIEEALLNYLEATNKPK